MQCKKWWGKTWQKESIKKYIQLQKLSAKTKGGRTKTWLRMETQQK